MSAVLSWDGPKTDAHPWELLDFKPGLPLMEIDRRRRDWLNAALQEGYNWLKESKEAQNMPRDIAYLLGDQWSKRRPSYKSSPVNNRLLRSMEQTVAILTDIRPVFEVKATDKMFDDQAELMTLITRAWWTNNDIDFQLAMAVIYAYLGSGFFRIVWNPHLCQGSGDFEWQPLSMYELMPIGPAHSLQAWEGCIYESARTIAWFRRHFPAEGWKVRPSGQLMKYAKPLNRPTQMGQISFDLLSRQAQRWVGSPNSQQVESVVAQAWYREFWVRDHCVAPETRVLTASLEWKRADELQVGEELVGCDEHTGNSSGERARSRKNNCRWLRRSKVEKISRLDEPCVKITTDRGVVICSEKHRWLARSEYVQWRDRKRVKGRTTAVYEWVFADSLKVGDKIAYLVEPWKEEKSHDSGYLAGLFDGEGYCSRYDVGFGQNDCGHNEIVLQKGMDLLEQYGFSFNYGKPKKNHVAKIIIRGGRRENLRFIGSIRPGRLLAKSSNMWDGKLLMGKGSIAARVLSVEKLGNREVVGLKTTTGTFIAEGMVSHNSLNTSENIVHMGSGNWQYDVKPGQFLYPRGRLMITGGDDLQVMYDGPNFYWHGQWPFVQIRLKPMPWQQSGLSELQSKIPLQDIVNTVLAGVLDNVKKAINPTLMFPDNAFSDATKRALDPSMPNAKIGYSPMVQPGSMKWTDPPVLPGYVMNMGMYAQNEMDDDSGLLDLASMGRKKVTPAGDTLESLKESQQTIMRLRGRYMEIAVRNGGDQMVPNFFQFYTMHRRMWLLGVKGVTAQDIFDGNTKSLIPSGVTPQDHSRLFSFGIASGSMLDVNRTETQLLAMALRRQGDMSRKTLFKMLNMDKLYDNVQKELEEEQQQMAAMAQQQAMPQHVMGKGSDNVMNMLKQG